jgi:hypothetical protein
VRGLPLGGICTKSVADRTMIRFLLLTTPWYSGSGDRFPHDQSGSKVSGMPSCFRLSSSRWMLKKVGRHRSLSGRQAHRSRMCTCWIPWNRQASVHAMDSPQGHLRRCSPLWEGRPPCAVRRITWQWPANVPEGLHDRSLARSAWDSAPQTSRPVGCGMIASWRFQHQATCPDPAP